jgi:gas vesicle protein
MKHVWWALGGAAVGAGAALLTTPWTGARARSWIRDRYTAASHDVSDAVGSKARHLRNVATGWQHRAGVAMESTSDLLHAAAGTQPDHSSPAPS